MYGEFEMSIHARLDLKDFEDLVNGRIVEIPQPKGVVLRIALQDVGLDKLAMALQKAIANYVVKL